MDIHFHLRFQEDFKSFCVNVALETTLRQLLIENEKKWIPRQFLNKGWWVIVDAKGRFLRSLPTHWESNPIPVGAVLKPVFCGEYLSWMLKPEHLALEVGPGIEVPHRSKLVGHEVHIVKQKLMQGDIYDAVKYYADDDLFAIKHRASQTVYLAEPAELHTGWMPSDPGPMQRWAEPLTFRRFTTLGVGDRLSYLWRERNAAQWYDGKVLGFEHYKVRGTHQPFYLEGSRLVVEWNDGTSSKWEIRDQRNYYDCFIAVSYTHLTLPTKA